MQIISLQEISKPSTDLWNLLSTISLEKAVENYLSALRPHTQRAYKAAFNKIFTIWVERGIASPKMSLQTFAKCNIENLLDIIRDRSSQDMSESTKQARCAAFISFTKYLHRVTGRIIPIALPNSGSNATFKKIRSKSVTKAMTLEQWHTFSDALQKISIRDHLIAQAIFQGAKRCGEVLMSRIDDIDWEKGCISYKQSKSQMVEQHTVIYYSKEYMNSLKEYLKVRTNGYIFITRNFGPVMQPHLYRTFAYASVLAGLPFRVHPHMLRATAITLLVKMGYHSDQIMQVTGHANPLMVLYYDKTPIEENITKKVKLF